MSRWRQRSTQANDDGGYVLVSVLWLLGLLAVGVATMNLYSVSALSLLTSSADKLKAEGLAQAGLEYAIFKMQASDPKQGLCGKDVWRSTDGVAAVSWLGETSRMDLNAAPPPLLRSVIAHFAADDATAVAAADAIMRNRPQAKAGQPASAGAAFKSVAELDGMGLAQDLVEQLKPYVTVFNGQSQIDPRLAPEQMLSLLPDITDARLRSLLDLKATHSVDIGAWRREAGQAGSLLTFDPARAVRILIHATLAGGSQSTYEVVAMRLEEDVEPYRILSWRNSATPQFPVSCPGEVE